MSIVSRFTSHCFILDIYIVPPYSTLVFRGYLISFKVIGKEFRIENRREGHLLTYGPSVHRRTTIFLATDPPLFVSKIRF
ncbi:unnamed protein product [Onchocerca flexuosa]|uniref:Uncharacterized protein n=1 Tax=Onchocerca flexuosa TaxID=387005 RepID=A0A183HG59_9BILA|nr:unnamed protein product [Onchocerca flexuosa]